MSHISETERKVVRLNPKENGMTPTLSIRMDVLDDFFQEPTQLLRPATMPRVLLASKSPRRRELLTEFGIEHSAAQTGVDDGLLVRGGVTPAEWVAALAYFKAAAAMRGLGDWSYTPGEMVIVGADTVVRKGRDLIGQPRDAAHAEQTIRTLRNGSHDVLTGVALIDAGTGERDMFVDVATVNVGEIHDDLIRDYVATGQWSGKAGAYNLRERINDGWPIQFTGDPTTIMGLPMQRLVSRLAEFADRCVRKSLA